MACNRKEKTSGISVYHLYPFLLIAADNKTLLLPLALRPSSMVLPTHPPDFKHQAQFKLRISIKFLTEDLKPCDRLVVGYVSNETQSL